MTFQKSIRNKKNEQGKRFGFYRTNRLKGKQVIKKLFSQGERFQSGNLLIIYLFSEEPRAGFIASKKIGGAVKRNRVKRLLREAYRMNKKIFTGLEVIFYAQGPLILKEIIDAFHSFERKR